MWTYFGRSGTSGTHTVQIDEYQLGAKMKEKANRWGKPWAVIGRLSNGSRIETGSRSCCVNGGVNGGVAFCLVVSETRMESGTGVDVSVVFFPAFNTTCPHTTTPTVIIIITLLMRITRSSNTVRSGTSFKN